MLILALAMSLRIFASLTPILHPWDERYHALVARNMIADPLRPVLVPEGVPGVDPLNWKWSHVWIHKPPLTLWLISLSLEHFGIGEFQVRIPSILLGSLAALLTYLIALRIISPGLAFLAGVLHAADSLLIQLCAGSHRTDHPDAHFQFWVALTAFFLLRLSESSQWRYILLSGIALGGAILTKWLLALFILGVGGLFCLGRNLSIVRTGLYLFGVTLIALGIALPWTFYTASAFPVEFAFEQKFNFRHITEALEGHEGNWLYHVDQLGRNHGKLIYIPLILGFWSLARRFNMMAGAVVLWFGFPFIFFSLIATKMPAYITPGYPGLFIVLAVGLGWLATIRFRFLGIVTVILVGSLLFRESVMPFLSVASDYQAIKASVDKYKSIATLAKTEKELPFILTGVRYPVEAMFYTGLPASPFASGSVSRLIDSGFAELNLQEVALSE